MPKRSTRFTLSTPQIIVLGFAAVIFLGALVLMLPVSSAQGVVTPFRDALFTATTSVCVTGLVVRDTGTYWSLFGQSVILVLIQIGGLGVVTVVSAVTMLSGRKISLMQRSTMQEAVAAPQVGGIVRLTGFILKTTLVIELLGAVLLAIVFCRDFGPLKGLWMALFHSVSAFCNAGLDLMGIREPYSSLTSYGSDLLVNLTVMVLIISGGIGFLTWDDIRVHKFRLHKYRMQSKVILTATAALIGIPAILLFFLEFANMPLSQRVLSALFQAVTPRTAGFNTADLTAMSESGQMLTIVLMLIGGSPGSTAGGMKTTTFAVIVLCAIAVFRKREAPQAFGRRICPETVSTAATLAALYVCIPLVCAMILSRVEALPFLTCFFETTSAVATVGLSLGITPTLSPLSHWILMALMYLGRVGGLTLIYAAWSRKPQPGRLPLEKITVG